MTEETKDLRVGGSGLKKAIIACAAVAAAAVVLWIIQLTGGLVQTGMRNLDSWGLYILSFMWFVGLSAGGLIISSVPRVFGMKGFGGISKIAIMTSLAATVCAVGMIIVDLGNPIRIWELFVYSNLSSPLMWDVLVITTYFILSVIYLMATLKNEAGQISDAACRVLSSVCLVVAVAVHTVTAWIIGVQVSHELWHTALMGPWFVCSALVSGTALVIVVCIALRRAGMLELARENLVKMAKWLGGFCIVDLYFFACELLTSGWSGGAGGAGVVSMLLGGPLAPFFWLQIAFCGLAAVICFVPRLRTTSLMCVAGISAMVAILLKRFQLVVGGFQIANLDMATTLTPGSFADISNGQLVSVASGYAGLVYVPSPIELGIFVGMLALGALVFLLGVKYLDLMPNEKSH